MRIRTIKPEWLEDDRLLGCSDAARLLTVALITIADDEGRGRLGMSTGARIWPGKPGKLDPALEELNGWFLIAYSVRGQRYFQLRNWGKHQRIQRPTESKLPAPEEAEMADSVRPPEPSGTDPESSVKVCVDSRTDLEGKGREGKGKEGNGSCTRSHAGKDVQEVFACWAQHHSTKAAILTDKRRTRIKARLAEGYTVAQLCAAIRGALKDPWLMGTDPKSTRTYRGLDTILRDGEQVERLMTLEATPQSSKGPMVLPDPALYVETPISPEDRELLDKLDADGRYM